MEYPIMFYSTNLMAAPLPFHEAMMRGLAPDKGLYMPEHIPQISEEELRLHVSMEYDGIAYDICRRFLEGIIPLDELDFITREAYNFNVPLEQVYERNYIMRLDQGPTASFKDFGARMMGRLMQYFMKENGRELLILTATSGDTGSAIANAFYGMENIRVVMLFPEAEVSANQRRQMSTLNKNVCTLAVNGKFDDCQAMVKRAFADRQLDHLKLGSANSINIGRLIPQIVYYFYAYSRLARTSGEQAIFAVPSGNFGNMTGGIMAKKMGLPVKRIIVATNANDSFPRYLESGAYAKTEPSINCISSAMNVGHPSNLARLVALYGGMMDEQGRIYKDADMAQMREDILARRVSESETREAIRQAWKSHNLLLEPHGAVGWAALQDHCAPGTENYIKDQLCISLETAHPAKFPQEVNKLLGFEPTLPPGLEGLEHKKENHHKMESDYHSFKDFLTANY